MEIVEDIHDCAGDGETEGSSEITDEAVPSMRQLFFGWQ